MLVGDLLLLFVFADGELYPLPTLSSHMTDLFLSIFLLFLLLHLFLLTTAGQGHSYVLCVMYASLWWHKWDPCVPAQPRCLTWGLASKFQPTGQGGGYQYQKKTDNIKRY